MNDGGNGRFLREGHLSKGRVYYFVVLRMRREKTFKKRVFLVDGTPEQDIRPEKWGPVVQFFSL